MATSTRPLLIVCTTVVIIMEALWSCEAREFIVGGGDGWVQSPFESYNHWAERNRFRVNDTLYFKYNKGTDSVLVVTREDYDKCNTKTPIQVLADGNSKFTFDHSGTFYFISDNNGSCQKGQKLIIMVLAIRQPPTSTTPPQPRNPAASPPINIAIPTAPPPKSSSPEMMRCSLSSGVCSVGLVLVGLFYGIF